jgi:hypothetical protein
MTELSELLGLKPEDMADIKDMDLSVDPKPKRFDIAALESEALSKRPELFQQDIEQKISQQDADIAFMQMFPSITPYYRYSYDSNKYLSKNDWYVVGVKMSLDLFSIPKLMYDRFTAQQQAELAAKRRMKIALSVLTQVRLSIIEYNETTDRLQLAADLVKERSELLEAVREQVRTGKLRESMLLDEDQRYLSARVQHLTNYAGALISLARLDNSVGRDWETGRSDALRSQNAAPTLAAAKALEASSKPDAPELKIAIEPEQKTPIPAKALEAPSKRVALGATAAVKSDEKTQSPFVPTAAPKTAPEVTSDTKPGDSEPIVSTKLVGNEMVASADPQMVSPVVTKTGMNSEGSPVEANPWLINEITLSCDQNECTLRIQTQQPIERYEHFQKIHPARLALDLLGKWFFHGPTTLPGATDFVDRIRLGVHPDRFRVVLDYKGDQNATRNEPVIEKHGNMLLVRIPKHNISGA